MSLSCNEYSNMVDVAKPKSQRNELDLGVLYSNENKICNSSSDKMSPHSNTSPTSNFTSTMYQLSRSNYRLHPQSAEPSSQSILSFDGSSSPINLTDGEKVLMPFKNLTEPHSTLAPSLSDTSLNVLGNQLQNSPQFNINNLFGIATMDNWISQRENLEQNAMSEDSGTLQLALNLSFLGINNSSDNVVKNCADEQNIPSNQTCTSNLNAFTNLKSVRDVMSTAFSGSPNILLHPFAEELAKKSQNMTECVPVPSSEHVAEIVGRQGCKIKALRAKTNTYIKTPVRGEEPVFVVTGRKEDVAKAKREILSAADHFSLIRASRKPSLDDPLNSTACFNNGTQRSSPGSQILPGQTTIQVRVPYRVVGLVVGPKGATIKHIQQETRTYIVTPSREREPIFEVTGMPENVQAARHQIESHIALRTGAPSNGDKGNGKLVDNLSDLAPNADIDTPSNQTLNENNDQDILRKLCQKGISSALNYLDSENQNATLQNNSGVSQKIERISKSKMCIDKLNFTGLNSVTRQNDLLNENMKKHQEIPDCCNEINNKVQQQILSLSTLLRDRNNKEDMFNSSITTTSTNSTSSANIFTNSCSSASSTTSSKSAHKYREHRFNGMFSMNNNPEVINIWKNLGDSLEIDEGIEEYPTNWPLPSNVTNKTSESHGSPTASTSPTDSLLGDVTFNASNYTYDKTRIFMKPSANKQAPVLSTSHENTQNIKLVEFQCNKEFSSNASRQECLICNERSISAALVPCGHNVFCMDCANQICSSLEAYCPICSLTVYHAIRVLV